MISGTGLGEVTGVWFGSRAADDVTVVSSTRIRARAPASGEIGDVQVTVTSPSGRSEPTGSTVYRRTFCEP